MPAPEELHARAQAAANRGAFAEALRLLDRARHLLPVDGDPDLLARVDLTRAYVEAETGHAGDGLARCAELLERTGLSPETRGLIRAEHGLLQMRRGDSSLALGSFDQALASLPEHRQADIGRALLNRGNVHLQRGSAHLAAEDFRAAREAFATAGLDVALAKAEHNLGYARLLTGDLVGALQMVDEAAVVLAPLSAAYRATVEQDRAEILTAAGRPREAVRSLESAVAAYGTRRLRTFQAECELILAWTVLREDPARARVIARRAARRFRDQASPARALRADAAATVAEISTGARGPALLARADLLVDRLRSGGDLRDAELLQLQSARLEVRRGALDEASRRLRGVRLGESSPVASRLLDREVRAELATARGDRRRAHAHVRAGLAELHAWQSSFGSLDLQSTLVGHGRALALQGLTLAIDDGSPALAFEWSERARALVGRVSPVRPPVDASVATDLAELRTLQAVDPGRRTAGARRAAELRDRIRQRSWYGAGGGAVGEPVSLDTLRQALDEDSAALVAHLSVRGRLRAVVVTAEDTQVLDLGSEDGLRDRLDGLAADLTMAAAHRTGGLAAAVRGSLHARLATVAEQLVSPVLGAVGDRRVLLTPSGGLSGTPWTLLPGLLGRPLTVAPSATRWLELRAVDPHVTRVGLVAGPRLERAEEEVTRAAAQWAEAEVLCGEHATAAAVSDLAGRVDVLHLAGHGTHPGENPLFAAVALADGPWFGYDIDQLPHTPATVVLSACELGAASVRSGEESVGMTAAWLHAGARTVLSAPVVIADDVACEALSRWHALVAEGRSPADALAEVSASAEDVVPLVCAGAGW